MLKGAQGLVLILQLQTIGYASFRLLTYYVILATVSFLWDVSSVELCLRCWKRVTFAMLVALCDIFWGLAKPAQDALLWSLQSVQAQVVDVSSQSSSDSSSGSSTRHRVRWFIAGIEVCRRAFLRFIGVGSARIDRTRRTFHGMDRRTLSGPGRSI